MPIELEVLRTQLVADAQELPTIVQGSRDSARTLSEDLARLLEEIQTKTASVATRAQELAGAEILPVNFTGFICNYRFGVVNGLPMHRFDIEIPNTGLWLACTFTSAEFDGLVLTADPVIDLFEPSMLDGRVVTVKRDAKKGRLVPVTFGAIATTPTGPVLLQDKEGKDVRAGDIVSLKAGKSGFDRTFKATVISYDAEKDLLTVQPTRSKTQKAIKSSQLTRFIRQGEDELSVGLVLVGLDKDDKELYINDVVRLLDESPEAKVAGKVIGKQDEQVILVARGDGKVGGPQGWAVNRSNIVKVVRKLLGNDQRGIALFAGDRVRTIGPEAEGGVVNSDGYLVGVQDDASIARVIRDDGMVSNDADDPGSFLIFIKEIIKI